MFYFHKDKDDVDFDKEIDVEIDVEADFDTKIEFDKEFDVDVKIDSDVDLDGNAANLLIDAEAVGSDTLVEVDASVLTIEGELSSVFLSVISAAD